MEAEASFSSIAPPVFDGDNYQMWAVRMETYLDALDLWEAVEEDYKIQALPNNPTMVQIKAQKEKKMKKSRAKACLFAAVSSTIFTRIMSFKTAKSIWDYLKEEYAGAEKIKGMQVLNLIREFELQKMKESETIKEYSDRLRGIANKDMSKISLAELLNSLQAPEQRRLMRQDVNPEGALAAKHHGADKNKKEKKKGQEGNSVSPTSSNNKSKNENFKGKYPSCHHCGRKGHPPFKCWRRPDAKCSKCNQTGHEAPICKEKPQQYEVEAQVADQEDEDQLFAASCFASSSSTESWLINSGCTNHMTNDKELFIDLRPTDLTKVKIGNGDYISVKGIGTIAITSAEGTKRISDVLYVPEIDQNLLSVGPLIEKGFKVIFEDSFCRIQDVTGQEIVKDAAHEDKGAHSWLTNFGDHLPNCQACQYGKQKRRPFLKSTWRVTRKLQLVHTDVSGPQRTLSPASSLLGGSLGLFPNDIHRLLQLGDEQDNATSPLAGFAEMKPQPDVQGLHPGTMMAFNRTIRPDIVFAVSILSRFMHCASEVHLRATKRVIRYIKGIIDFGVKFKKCQHFKLLRFSDSDWGGSVDDMKSKSGYCFSLGSGVFSWCCKKQEIVAQSTAEAEFVTATAAVNQALWLRKLLCDLKLKQLNDT
ncbi:hypothetical protein KPL71_023444 [Citrus sinensis]|uniref:Uncharacterized protein n=1 Tax=Citrus sinensis TaxID=2711 RepID=A0ACB8IJ04_CITSI|nr:hypothetical protein KPL71_023444 [Citrus sinensis]